ncbi:MAG: D-alanyl-D-alanine carboxypeptidase, partial [Pseudomonadota bacterium]|nr:D-alanyl-D-alanine carboxypeptidase [Pseudomonadota bacterium]
MGVALAAATQVHAATSNPKPPEELAQIPVSMLVDLGSGQVLEQRRPDIPFLPASVT